MSSVLEVGAILMFFDNPDELRTFPKIRAQIGPGRCRTEIYVLRWKRRKERSETLPGRREIGRFYGLKVRTRPT